MIRLLRQLFECSPFLLVIYFGIGCQGGLSPAAELTNGQMVLQLGLDAKGNPAILSARWADDTAYIWREHGAQQGGKWQLRADSLHLIATASDEEGHSWHVALAREQNLIRLWRSRTCHQGGFLDSLPIWETYWDLPGKPQLQSWEALSYQALSLDLGAEKAVLHGSDEYSSQAGTPYGQLPFWQLSSDTHHFFSCLAWSGGWRVHWQGKPQGVAMQLYLPPAETQLQLAPGDSLKGPEWILLPVRETNPNLARQAYHAQWQAYHQARYPQPEAGFPLIFNHWYAAGRQLDAAYLRKQAQLLQEYGFDFFVVDDGWFESVGRWYPDPARFSPGEMEAAFAGIRRQGLHTGLWSCPWLADSSLHGQPGLAFDEPAFYNSHMRAYSLDPVSMAFDSFLVAHLDSLSTRFSLKWWKYDQELFGPERSRHGKFRKMQALQNGLEAVRKAFPALIMENCLSGGRMLNGFTDGIAQVHWLRDGGHNDPSHARSNAAEVLGALHFLPPSKLQRWTNRLNEIQDEALFRAYCRSCMAGVWGMSLDLEKLNSEQQAWLKEEISLYRSLEASKASQHYALYPETRVSPWQGVWFHGGKAGLSGVFFNWAETVGPIPAPPETWLAGPYQLWRNGKKVGGINPAAEELPATGKAVVVQLLPE